MGAPQHLPRQVPIEAYGNGGFRFGGMSHRGSLLCLPSGIWGWPVTAIEALDLPSLAPVLALGGTVTFLLLGTGRSLVRPSREVARALKDAGVWLEVMDTGAAARTYNVLLAEDRVVAAALIAVE